MKQNPTTKRIITLSAIALFCSASGVSNAYDLSNKVYRFCQGYECPVPTPKKPRPTRSVVTETNADGIAVPVDQAAAFAAFVSADKSQQKPLGNVLHTPQTAKNNEQAAAIAAKLNDERRAILSANGIELPNANTPKQPRFGHSVPPSGMAPKMPKQTNTPELPTTGTRIPKEPAA